MSGNQEGGGSGGERAFNTTAPCTAYGPRCLDLNNMPRSLGYVIDHGLRPCMGSCSRSPLQWPPGVAVGPLGRYPTRPVSPSSGRATGDTAGTVPSLDVIKAGSRRSAYAPSSALPSPPASRLTGCPSFSATSFPTSAACRCRCGRQATADGERHAQRACPRPQHEAGRVNGGGSPEPDPTSANAGTGQRG